MEGPLEVKDSTAGVEESIKSEAPVQNPDSSDRSDGAVSPPPNCSICLGKLVNTSFTDSCLHQFCFTCLLQWSKIKTECPLCKQTFKSIIHNVRSEEDYDQYHVPRELATFDLFELGHMDTGTHRFHYRTTMTGHHRRPHEIVLNPEQVARREQLPSIAPQVPIGERIRRRVNPTDYRRTIYRHGIWATALPDVFGRFRECSADFYRREPRELNRLIPWLNRELQVLLNNNASHVAYVLRVILDALCQYDIRSPEFRELVRPHFAAYTDHFVHELLNYARTNFDLIGYDQSVTYLPQGLSNEYVSNILSPTSSSTSTSSDDSDIRVLDEAIDLRTNTDMPSVGPHTINMPGPSTVAQTFQLDIPYNVPDVLTISSDSSVSDNDCEVIGYVKPRHERTPEIIELLSSDPEEINISHVSNDNTQAPTPASYEDIVQPSTSHNIKKRTLASSSNESNSDSDSDYIFRKYQNYTRKRTKRSSGKKRNRSVETRVRNRTSRNLSSSGESDVRKKGTKRNTQRTSKRRLSSSSSDSSSREIESKPMDEKKSRTSQYSTKGRSERVIRTRGKARQISDTKQSHRKESRYKSDRQSESRSSSVSSYDSRKEKRDSSRRRESQRHLSDNDSTWITRDVLKKNREFKSKTREVIVSSSDSDEDFRSHSQCSNYSNKSYTHKKKSKHKDKHKSKKRRRSSSRTHSSSNRSRLTRRHPA
ncbi:hypothetical protein WN51_02817 [Melipona quadrifasciata]|uniref:E3 ubiquitin-protein ligase Topors n=1 Tax=Melipona quadrifasciata TaxID=166423 RepID=A0A0N0U7H3_9HYME|nr:hypothetical protein WN51_02817 [Melipona quadrifasciata]